MIALPRFSAFCTACRFYAWRFSLKDASGEHVGLIEFGGINTIREDGTRTARVE